MEDLKYLRDDERELAFKCSEVGGATMGDVVILLRRLNEARAERLQYREKLLKRLGMADGPDVSVLKAVRELAERLAKAESCELLAVDAAHEAGYQQGRKDALAEQRWIPATKRKEAKSGS